MKKLLLIAGLVLSLWGINYPFAGGYNANNNYLTLAAKNFVRFGTGPIYFAGQKLPAPVPYYLHHPVLIFPLSTIPFLLFGFHNWVVHVTNFLFVLGDIFLIYKIGELLWNKKTGLWAAALAAIFPMTTFFWKYIFFEQGSLFFNLCVVYFLFQYVRRPLGKYVTYIFIFTFLSGLLDWGVLYLLVPILIFRKRTVRPIVAYLVAAGLSLGVYLAVVYRLEHGFGALYGAIAVHGFTPTLLSLPLWPLRLLLITITRFFIYFTPLSLVWFFGKKSRTLWFFFIFGCMNIFVLPTVTWENSYFLFYFIPFLAFSGALWMQKHGRWWIVGLIIIWSLAVNYFKLEQLRKQFWQYDEAVSINRILAPFETVGAVSYSGDILEQYFFHPTVPMSSSDLHGWQAGTIHPELTHVVFAGTLIGKDTPLPADTGFKKSPAGRFVNWYRVIRDIFSVGQL